MCGILAILNLNKVRANNADLRNQALAMVKKIRQSRARLERHI